MAPAAFGGTCGGVLAHARHTTLVRAGNHHRRPDIFARLGTNRAASGVPAMAAALTAADYFAAGFLAGARFGFAAAFGAAAAFAGAAALRPLRFFALDRMSTSLPDENVFSLAT